MPIAHATVAELADRTAGEVVTVRGELRAAGVVVGDGARATSA